jgi:hypothetical protein
MTGMGWFEFDKEGKVVELREEETAVEVLKQLGLIELKQ